MTNTNIVVKMTYYYINSNGLMQKQVGGEPPSDTFVAVAPDGIMRKYVDGQMKQAIPVPDNPLKDIIEQKSAATLLGYGGIIQRKMKKSKPKSKRKKCRCKK